MPTFSVTLTPALAHRPLRVEYRASSGIMAYFFAVGATATLALPTLFFHPVGIYHRTGSGIVADGSAASALPAATSADLISF